MRCSGSGHGASWWSHTLPPWRAFVDGEERTGEIHEIEFAKTGEIRVGVFEIR